MESRITRLFEIRRERDLWALQPAFRLSGKVSWLIAAVHPTAKLRYTKGEDLEQRVAVVDEVIRVNPYDKHKGTGGRVTGLLNNFPDWAYLNAKNLARQLGLRARS